jgi:hypothetical protein
VNNELEIHHESRNAECANSASRCLTYRSSFLAIVISLIWCRHSQTHHLGSLPVGSECFWTMLLWRTRKNIFLLSEPFSKPLSAGVAKGLVCSEYWCSSVCGECPWYRICPIQQVIRWYENKSKNGNYLLRDVSHKCLIISISSIEPYSAVCIYVAYNQCRWNSATELSITYNQYFEVLTKQLC